MEEKKHWAIVIAPIFLVFVVSVILQATVLSRPEEVKNWLMSFGPWFIVAYIFIQVATIVIAPIGGAFIWLPMMAILGPGVGLILMYFVTTPSFFINFFLAKRFGRGLVKTLIGIKALDKIDHYSKDAGNSTFAILKVFQGGYFDYVSYAAGLTKMSWKTFSIINIIGGIPSAFITYFVFSRFDNFLLGVLAFYVVSGTLIAISIYINHRLIKHKRSNNPSS